MILTTGERARLIACSGDDWRGNLGFLIGLLEHRTEDEGVDDLLLVLRQAADAFRQQQRVGADIAGQIWHDEFDQRAEIGVRRAR